MNKALNLLSMARRAGRIEPGYDASAKAARTGRAALLAAAADISEKTYKNLRYEADRAGVPAVRLPVDMERLGRACGVRAGVLAVTDPGFAQAVLAALEKEAPELAERKKEDNSL